jgi:hypothetical protein
MMPSVSMPISTGLIAANGAVRMEAIATRHMSVAADM